MSDHGDLLIAIVLGVLIVAAFTKPTKKWFAFGGLLSRDRKGRMTLVLTPAKKKRKGGRR